MKAEMKTEEKRNPVPFEEAAAAKSLPATENPIPYMVLHRRNSGQITGTEKADGDIPEPDGTTEAEMPGSSEKQTAPTAPAATRESLWSLLAVQGLTVSIPALQRGYIHGRSDAGTCRVRQRLLDDLFGCLRAAADGDGDAAYLELGFIYGNLEEGKHFIPVDGQQRLTTLFLLHWLLALRSGRLYTEPEVRKCLLRFQYDANESSGRFCRRLVLHTPQTLQKRRDKEPLSARLRNSGILFDTDSLDPSIRGMLTVLDELEERADSLSREEITPERLFTLLTSGNPPIGFQFLNLNDSGMSDSVYIKMNARGRPLTLYESVKASLRSWLAKDAKEADGEGPVFSEKFLQKLNGPWTEFFWQKDYRPRGPHPTVDLPILRFLRFMILTDCIVNMAGSAGQTVLRNAMLILMQEPDESFFSRLFRDGFRVVGELRSENPPVTAQTFRRIEKILDLLTVRKRETGSIAFMKRSGPGELPLDEEGVFRRLTGLEEKRTLDYEEIILLSAEYAFLLRYAHIGIRFRYSGALRRWLHVLSNLTQGVLNLQADDCFSMIRSVGALTENGFALHCSDRFLEWPQVPESLSVFPAFQLEEEALKAALARSDFRWKKAITDAENSFLGGCIGMLFDFAGIRAADVFRTAEKRATEGLDPDIPPADGLAYSDFIRYLRRFRLLFDRNGVRRELEESEILRRALLCFGGENSYLLPPGRTRQCFLDNMDRDVGFRRLMRDDHDGRRETLRELMDDLREEEPVVPQLQSIIERKTFSGTERWKEYLVSMPEILCSVRSMETSKPDPEGQWIFQSEQRYIRRNHADDILLLSRTQTSSINREYYSYVLFLKARKRGLKVHYHADYTDSSEKYAWFINLAGEPVSVSYRNPDQGFWRFVARREEDFEVLFEGNMREMLDWVRENTEKEQSLDREENRG